MNAKIKFFTAWLCLPFFCFGQYQAFDGYDSLQAPFFSSAIYTMIDTSNSANIWQIGSPQKIIFDDAASFPNAIITDTIGTYPINNESKFMLKLPLMSCWGCVLALQWMQKLDMESNQDGGIVEYSMDSITWFNIFNNPYVYNLYGFLPKSLDTLSSGDYAFSGTDSLWRGIWLCFDNNYFTANTANLFLRFKFSSDSIDTQQEGWIIDNLFFGQTITHTAKLIPDNNIEYISVFPTNTSGRVNIEAEKLQEFHIIENIELISVDGRIVQSWGTAPTKFFIDIKEGLPNGVYYVKIKTNKKTETFPIVLNR